MKNRLGSFEFFGDHLGQFPDDFSTDFHSDYRTTWRPGDFKSQNWPGRAKRVGRMGLGAGVFQPDFTVCKSEGGTANCPSEYVKEFSGGVFQPDFTVCKSEGGTANCPSEYVREFSGMEGMGGKILCMLIAFAVGAAAGWYARHAEIIVLPL